MTPTDTLREAVIDAILWSRWNEEGEPREPEWFVQFRVDFPDHVHQAGIDADAALSAIEAAGWLVVPVEPTEPMRFAGGTVCEQIMFEGHPLASGVIFDDMAIVYTAMLSAAPSLDATVRQNKLSGNSGELADAYRDLAARQTDTEPDIAKVARDNRSELYMPLDEATVRGEEG